MRPEAITRSMKSQGLTFLSLQVLMTLNNAANEWLPSPVRVPKLIFLEYPPREEPFQLNYQWLEALNI